MSAAGLGPGLGDGALRNLAEMLQRRALATPDAEALRFAGASVSYAEFWRLAETAARALQAAGVRRGDVVLVAMDHCLGQAAALFAAALADAAFVISNQHLKREQLLHQIADCEPAAAICAPRQAEIVRDALTDRRVPLLEMAPDGRLADAEAPAPSAATPEKIAAWATRAIPADVGCLIYTSGSTGRPKGVVIPHRTLLDGARIVPSYLKITAEDRILSILPFSFDYGLNQLLSAVRRGAPLVILSFVFPKDLVTALQEERITGFAAVPSLWPQLLERLPADRADWPRFPDLRYVTTAGGPHSEALLRSLTAFFPDAEIIIMYGLTESFRSTYLPFDQLFKRIGSIGKAVPEVEILVLDEEGRECPPGVVGELHHRGAFVSYGYLNNPELTDAKLLMKWTGGPGSAPERIVRSGDLVKLDDEGYIYFLGRADAMIKSKGYRVSPSEVEEAVCATPGVRHAAAFGAAGELGGDVVIAAYDLAAEADPAAFDEGAMRRKLRGILPYYAAPEELMRLDAMPLTPNGKVDYAAVRALWRARREEAGS